MTGASQEVEPVDWAAAEKQERRRSLVFMCAPSAVLAAQFLVMRQPLSWLYWSYAGVLVAVVVTVELTSWWPSRLRDKFAASLRVEYATRKHFDPGPELRTKADERVDVQRAVRWFPWWGLMLGPLLLLLSAPWSRPLVAVPAAVLAVAGGLSWGLPWRTRQEAARRWSADPPGPPRMPAVPQETSG